MSNGTLGGTSSGRGAVYYVEGRTTFTEPQIICDKIFDGEWRAVPTTLYPVGVPTGLLPVGHDFAREGYMSYECAETIARWFIAYGYCLQARIRKVNYSFTCEVKAAGYGPVIERGKEYAFTADEEPTPDKAETPND